MAGPGASGRGHPRPEAGRWTGLPGGWAEGSGWGGGVGLVLALDRAFASELPYLVNVVTDPADQYPSSSNLS
jgi:hypothetical protein